MQLEACRIVSDWLKNETYGVNAMLLTLPVDAVDAQPPEIMAVLNATEDDVAARGQAPQDWPVLAVAPGGAVQMQGEVAQTHRDADGVPVAIGYITRDADSAAGVRDAHYTMRAITKSIRELNKNANVASRTRNSVCLMLCTGITYQETQDALANGGFVRGVVLVTFKARDSAP